MGSGATENQIWVTYALSEEDVPKALTLCASLRKVLTWRKVGVIVSQKLGNHPWRECLSEAFDFYFELEEHRNTKGLKENDFVKLFPLTLKSFEKILVLAPNMLVIKQCDKLFDEEQEGNGNQDFVLTRENGMSIFLVKPSPKIFNVLMSHSAFPRTNGNGTGMEKYWRKWLENQSDDPGFLDDAEYNHCLTLSSTSANKNIMNAAIINLMDLPFDSSLEKFSLFGQTVLKYRTKIYEENVQPLLNSINKPVSLTNKELYGSKEPIAIVGMSCRYPSANNLDEFWSLLLNGKDGTSSPPESRWLSTQDHSGLRHKTNAGFLKTPVDNFDAKFFGISPMEMVFLDPQHRLLHELVWEGLEDAALNPQELRGSNGSVFIGSWTNDYKKTLRDAGFNDFYRKYMGNSIGAAAARISFLLGLTGPSIATESGCSSAMVAVHLACKSLQVGETNLALACGVNLLLYSFDKTVMPMVLSLEGHCKTFDAKADGFARAEGAGVLVLKRLSDAVRDGDKIWALIRGSAMTQEGISKSLGTPTVHCESMAMKNALDDAGVEPEQVSYVETHGTGTAVGDPMEVAAIAKAYHSENRKEPLIIGSVKTNVGHTESCSGITGIMKTVLAMQHEIIPPHINFDTLNPAIDLDAVPAKIPLKPEQWLKKEGKRRLAGVSSFGITGTDAHAILEESPSFQGTVWDGISSSFERPLHLMKISGKSKEALEILLESIKNHLDVESKAAFPDICYTANVGRADFSQRAVVIANSKEDAVRNIVSKKIRRGEVSTEGVGKICFLFTGQGSQYPGMAKQLYETSPVFRMHFEYCEKLLKNSYNIDIAQVLWSENKSNEVSRTIYSQTSIFCVEYALLKLWESWGVKADFALGHSLGEFAAAVCAGILTVEDAIKLVAERSRLIDLLPRGKMLVIKADKQRVDSLMKKFAGNDKNKQLDYAAINSPDQTVVAGDSELIMQFSASCKETNLKCIILEATHAFHSKHMDPILNDYRAVTKTIQKVEATTNCNYISGLLGSCITPKEIDSEYWVQHTRDKVLFLDASKKAVELGCKTFIEIGPQPILSALTMMNNDLALTCLPSLKRNESNWTTLLSSLSSLYISGLEINWKGFDQLYKRSKVSLPNYPFTSKKFWPESISSTTSSIHPLLGTVLSNPSSSKLFQCGLSTKQIEYVKDHTIGNNVIFPGAGFLEMCLAAGLATIEASTDSLSPPSRAMKIENLSIEAPLRLQESSTCQLHTVAEFNSTTSSSTPSSGEEWNDLTIKIFKANPTSDSIKWVNHASATFSPMPTPQEKEPVVRLNHKQLLETLKKPSDDEFITQVYDKLASVGLKFGPTFKSIEKLWRDKDCNGKGTLVAKIKVPFESQDEGGEQPKYIVHPVVLDAMIQALVMLRPTSNLKKSLYVPIKIGKFVWISSTTCKELYIQSFEATGSSLLLDSEGKLLGVMSSVELIETTVKTIESILEQQTTSMPHLWEEIWKPSPTPLLLSGDAKASSGKFYTEEFRREFETNYSTPSEYVHQTLQFLEQFIYLHTIQALYETGWEPKLNQEFGEKSLSQQLKIVPAFHQYFGFICDMLEAKGILEKLSENKDELTWKIIKLPPSHHQISNLLSTPELSTDLNQRFPPTPLFKKVGESLSSFFSGSKTPISVIFPEGPKTCPTVADVYIEYFNQVHVSKLEEIGGLLIKHFWNTQPNKQVEVRILEVGAGTGSCSQKLMDIMAENGIRFEYTYTDISAAFFPAAEKRLEKHLKWVKFKKLNIEEDPLAQSFAPDYYDFVLAGEVIHATKDICESLRNIRVLMKPYGRVAIQETTRLSLLIGFLFGTLEGYWRFQDFELRKRYCILEKAAWAQVMEANGLKNEVMFSVYDNYHSYMVSQKTEELPLLPISAGGGRKWLVFHEEGHPVSEYIRERIVKVAGRSVMSIKRGKKFEEGRDESWFTLREKEYEDFVHLFQAVLEKPGEIEGIVYCWSLDKTAFSQDEVLQPYFNLSKSLLTLNLKKNPRLAVITENVVPLEENELSSFPNSTLWGFTKSMKNENVNLSCKCIEVIGSDGESEEEKNLRLEDIFHELWSSEKDTQVAFSGKRRWIPKFTPHKPIIDPLKLPNGTNRFQLVLPETRSISDLQFGNLDVGTVREDEVEVEIRASALNFRDVLSVIKPSEEFKDSNTVGFDFSGVVTRIGDKVGKWRVGDCVFGCNIYFTAMPSHLTLSQDLLLKLPENLSFCEGATMPAVYATSVLCLLDVAKIKKEDVVLIHTASGGVGLSAIEICKHVGCTIIATAGSKRKQNYLRSLGIQHIFHSRNTQYGDQILELTKGRGVDVVLNSLTSEGFKEATLKACAKGARFVEMSVLNIWSKEEVNKLRPDVQYTTIDLSKSNKGEWIRLLDSLRNLSINGSMVMQSIPYTRFDAVNIREALQYMQKAKHIGKVVCTMPQLRMEGECELKTFTPMFNPTSTYLITGGLGGIGFAVCKWMLEKGGKHFLLAGRSLPTPTIQSKINELNSKGANIIPVQLDVSSFDQCKLLIKNKLPNLKLPPLKGVMHAAGTLADGIITNLDWSKYELTFNAKVSGTFNLHELTKHLNLEHFVTFSSMAAMLGSLGQSNHSAGNCFEDAISHYRHSIGLPSTSINWGQWGEVGVATEVDFPGMKPISNLQAFSAIEYALNSQHAQLAVLNVDSVQVIGMIYSQMSVYLDERLWNASRATVKTTINSEEFWRQYDSLIEAEEKQELVKSQLQSILRTTLKLDDMEVVNCDSNLQEMGVDSLMFVEIKNCLQTLMGERVTVNAGALRDCNTVNLIVSVMMRMIEGDDELENETAIPTLEQVNELIREDCVLPEDITPKLAAPAPPICEVKKVLLTGATGVLGSYILKELSNSPQITQVICILRGNNVEKARARLENVLRGKNLLSKVAMEKIQCVMGDVALPNLGLEEHVWKELSGSIDAIFNCSAKVDHTERYRKGSSRRDGRAVNIGGTKNLLQFACEQRLKHFFQASSILAVLTADGNNQLTEDWPEVGDYDNVGTFSYQISKFVGDVLVKEAVKRGIPCRVFRFPLLSGERETGQCEPSTNHALLRFMFMLKKGIMASLPWPLIMLPVDVCAKSTIRIFFDERAPQSDIYNVGIAKPDVEQEFVNVATKLGYKVDLVEFSEFVKILKDTENNDKTLTQERPLLDMFLEMYSDEDFILGMYANTAVLHRWLEGCPNVFRNRKMETFLPEFYEEQQPTMEYIYKDLMYVKSQGWFGKFGL